MTDLERSGFTEFDRLRALVRQTRELLDALVGEGSLPAGGADYLAGTTLPHLDRVEAGFRGWLRADQAGFAELQYLVLRVGSMRVEPARSAAERRSVMLEAMMEAAAVGRRSIVDVDAAWDLFSIAHTRLVLAFLPRLPDESVRFPAGRRSYADIPAPRGPAELADRIEELERQLWRTALGRSPSPADPAFRRTYGFFDAAERLGEHPFGRPS